MAISIFLASLISIRVGFSVAIIEVVIGAIFGNLGYLHSEAWMTYIATLGGIILTFLAGTEINVQLMREKFKESFLIGFLSFLIPFIGVAGCTYYLAGWSLQAALIGGTALSTTSLAVVYSVLVESGLCRTEIGKMIMAATFITDMGTAIALSILFITPTLYTLVFIVVSVIVIILAAKYSRLLFNNPRVKESVIEPEIKFIFLLLVVFMYFASLGDGHAVLPTFLLGLFMGKYFAEHERNRDVTMKLRTVAYAFITPIFFIIGGMNVSVSLILGAFGLFAMLFILKMITKFMGVYVLACEYIPGGAMYTTLLMSTGLTFGTIASVFGLQMGYITQEQYSVLVGVVIASAVIPTVIAQKWYKPVHSEDVSIVRPIGKKRK
jgi:Kef-type K+ transport system membrane component KefB